VSVGENLIILVALPGQQQMSPARASVNRQANGFFSRSGSIMYLPRVFLQADTMSLMIFSGSSLLGIIAG